MKQILLIEDNLPLSFSMKDRLNAEGYGVTNAANGNSALQYLKKDNFDLAIVDIMLPDINGFELVKEYRNRNGYAPILMLTARSGISDKVTALRIGADDYVTKPFDFTELTARIEALLRRADTGGQTQSRNFLNSVDFSFGPFTLVYKKMQLLKNGKPIQLSHQEFKLLACLIKYRGGLVKTETLLYKIWGYEEGTDAEPATVYTHIAWLRRKLKTDTHKDGYIKTVRCIGYMFSE